MTPLIPPLHVAKMPFIWGNIVATPPGHYNPIRIYSFYLYILEQGVCQGPFGEGQKKGAKQSPFRGVIIHQGRLPWVPGGRIKNWDAQYSLCKLGFVDNKQVKPLFEKWDNYSAERLFSSHFTPVLWPKIAVGIPYQANNRGQYPIRYFRIYSRESQNSEVKA